MINDRVSHSVSNFTLTNDQKILISFCLSKVELESPYEAKIKLKIIFEKNKFKNQILIKSLAGNFYANYEGRNFTESLMGLQFDILKCLQECKESRWESARTA